MQSDDDGVTNSFCKAWGILKYLSDHKLCIFEVAQRNPTNHYRCHLSSDHDKFIRRTSPVTDALEIRMCVISGYEVLHIHNPRCPKNSLMKCSSIIGILTSA